mgnify:FL=1
MKRLRCQTNIYFYIHIRCLIDISTDRHEVKDNMTTQGTKSHDFDAVSGCLLAGLLLVLFSTRALALGTPAGTSITNRATLDFQVSGAPQRVFSNNNAVTVQELINVVTVWQDAADIVTTSSATAQVLTFLVSNTGNGIETFSLSVNNAPPGADNYDPLNARIHIDADGNNSYDGPGIDPLYIPGSNDPRLDANAVDSVVLFVLNDTPAALLDGDTGDSALTAQATTPGAATAAPGTVLAGLGDGGVDAVVGSSNASATATGSYLVTNGSIDVSIAKSAEVVPDGQVCKRAPCEPVPGATIRYTLQVEVSGSGIAENLVITDSIPANTSYTPESITLDSTPQTDATGDDPGSFTADLVSVDLGDTAGPANFTITLDVTVN